MLYLEEDAAHLKKWIVRRLENTSDADTDVLADYVLALLRHDGDTETVRRLFEEEIPDFLKEDSSVFVSDVFDAIQYKSYLPGAPPPPRRPSIRAALPPTLPVTLPAPSSGGDISMSGVPRGPMNGSKKRSYNDRGDFDAHDGGDYQYSGDVSGRAFKQPRRGGSMGRGGRFDSYSTARGGRRNELVPMHQTPVPPPGFSNLPQMPSPPPGMPPLDPNNPMAALLAMQAMGFPVPSMQPFQQAPSPAGSSSSPITGFPPTPKRAKRCRDYDTKGFCARGSSCIYEHGNDSIYVPPGAMDEYDPTNSSLIPGLEISSMSNRATPSPTFENSRGSDRGRGRGRGAFRSDRGGNSGQAPSRRGGRAEFSSDRPNFDKSKTGIVVENIPEEKFSEEAVREFFSEFGTILEVTMKPYKRLALVKYEDWGSAKAAYSSPKVIFDNRFVKVYWFTGDDSLPKPPAVAGTGTNGNASHIGGNVAPSAAPPTPAPSEPHIDLEEFARKQQEVQKAHEEKVKKKAEVEAKAKELEQRQEELIKKQAEEKRKLMERLAAKTNKSGTPLPTDQNSPTRSSNGKPTSQTEVLKAQLAALEAEAKSLGIDPTVSDDASWSARGRGRGRGIYRGRGAFVPRGYRGGYRGRGGAAFGASPTAYKLDNRPKKLALTGVDFTDPDKDESLRHYLLGVGEYTDIEATPGKTFITFTDRSTAEKFMYGLTNGEIPSAGRVELSWIQTPLPPVNLSSKAAVTTKPDSGDGMQVDQADEMGHISSPMPGSGHGQDPQQQHQELDYDYADDNDWAQ